MKKKQKNKKYTGISKLVFNTVVYFIIVVLGLSVFFGSFAIQRIIAESPKVDIEKINSYEPTKILDNKEEIIATVGGEIRENIAYSDLPQVVIDAFLAVEDSRYESHNGFDIPRFIKSFLVNVRSGDIRQGGSTITMQLIDNSFFNADTSQQTVIQKIKQKISEITMGMDLEKSTSKEEILTAYLNKINFGDNIRGIGKASEYYFNKHISEVNLSEAAFLAGVINAPNLFNPYQGYQKYENGTTIDHYQEAVNRRNNALDLMKLHGYISQREHELAINTELAFQLSQNKASTSNNYFAYTEIVEKEVMELTGKNPQTVSMTIYTAMDKTVQDVSNDISNKQRVNFIDQENLQIGAAVIDNVNHELVAINPGFGNYGGDNRRNFAMVEKNNIGSTSKPLVSYTPAFDNLGFSTAHTFDVQPLKFRGTDFTVTNLSLPGGLHQLDDALANSYNTTSLETFYRVWDKIGLSGYNQLMKNLGLTVDDVTDQFSIGGGEFRLTPYELAGAYSTFANKGVYYKPRTVRKVVIHATGETITAPEPQGTRAYSEEAAYMMATLLRNNVSGGYSNSLGFFNGSYPAYAKSGTSDWGVLGREYGIPDGVSKDLWITAFSGNTTVATWVGYDSRNVTSKSYFTWPEVTVRMPHNITKILLDTATRTRPNVEITRPSGVVNETHVKGVYPYMKVPSEINNDAVVSGLIIEKFLKDYQEYKPGVVPESSGFSVSVTNDKKQLQFKFNEIKDEDPIYGKVKYKITIKNSSGSEVFNQSFETFSGDIDITNYANDKYTITGEYEFEKGTSPVPAQSFEYTHNVEVNDSENNTDNP